jgi:cell wall-associated NlpC family hydrolase
VRLDGRINPVRGDLASQALEGLVRAPRFAKPSTLTVLTAGAAIRAAPNPRSEQVDELLFGETFDVLQDSGGFVWGQARRDGYVGWIEASSLTPAAPPPTHWIATLRTFAYAEPSIKSPATGPYSLNSLVSVTEIAGAMARVTHAGWMPRSHLARIGCGHISPARAARAFLGAPYLWGGRNSLGLDCSGLVQQALYAAGRACPRDSDQQAALGAPAPTALRRGDLVAWRGHIGLMLDGRRLIHANAHHMAVAIEPLARAITRIREGGGGEPTAYRRL